MKKLLLLMSSLFVCAVYLGAQTYPDQSSNPPSGQISSDHQTKVRGCLGGSGGNYALTDKSGNTYQLTGDTSKLNEHVGHTVEVTGITVPSSSAGSDSSSSTSAGKSGGLRTLGVTSVKHISETCNSSH